MMQKNKQAEKCKKEIEQLRKQPQNHRCANCSQLSVPYVCLTYGTFVCTRCAGLLREINAKVKSISASIFTPAEVERITGNDLDKKNYLARWDESIYKLPGPDDKERASEFIRIKYEELRWATNEIREKAGKEPLPDVQLPVVQQEDPVIEQISNQLSEKQTSQEQQQEIKQEVQQKPVQPQQQLPQFVPKRQVLAPKQKINPFDDLFNNNSQQQEQQVEQKTEQKVEQQQVQQPQQPEQKQEQQPQQQTDDLFADIFGSAPSQPAQPAQKQDTMSIFDQQPTVQKPVVQQQPASNNGLDDLLNW